MKKKIFSLINLYQNRELSSLVLMMIVFLLPIWIKLTLPLIPFLLVAWIIEGRWKGIIEELKKNKFALLAVLFYLLHLIGVLYSVNWKNGLNDVQQKLSLIIIPLIFLGFSKNSRIVSLNRILNLFVVGNIVSGLICLSHAFYDSFSLVSNHLTFNYIPFDAPYENNFRYIRFAFLYHPSYLAMYFTFSIAILLKRINENKKGFILQIIYFIAITYFGTLIYFLSSRAGIGAASITFVIGVIWLVTNRIKWVLKVGLVGFASLIIMLLYLGLNKQSDFLKRFNEEFFYNLNPKKSQFNNLYDTRYYLWQCIPDVMEKNWIFGTGTGDSQIALNQGFIKIDLIEQAKNNYNAHNQFLESLVSLGLVGLVSLLVLLFYPVNYLLKRENDFLPILFLVIIFINFMLESMLSRIAGILFFAIFYGLFFCFKEFNENVN